MTSWILLPLVPASTVSVDNIMPHIITWISHSYSFSYREISYRLHSVIFCVHRICGLQFPEEIVFVTLIGINFRRFSSIHPCTASNIVVCIVCIAWIPLLLYCYYLCLFVLCFLNLPFLRILIHVRFPDFALRWLVGIYSEWHHIRFAGFRMTTMRAIWGSISFVLLLSAIIGE